VSWPDKISARGEIRTQYGHIIDLVPTVLDALGIEPPATIRGVTQDPLQGVSFAHTFNEADAATQHHTQYFEMFGHRSIYHDGWRAVCPWPGPSYAEAAQKGRHVGGPIDSTVLADLEANDWELYDLTTDHSETKNVAAENRAKVIEMIGRWWAEAGKYNVLPLDGSLLERLNVERATIARPRDKFVYYPGGSPVPFSAAPKVYNRAFSITADVQIPEGGAQGVLIAQGGRVGGYSFFVKDTKLHFVYNFLGRDFFTISSNTDVPVGEASLRYEFEPTGEPDFTVGKGVPATGQLYIDQQLVGAVDMPHTVPNIFSTEGLTCGYDGGSRVAPDFYQDAFPFNGTLKRVTIDLSGELIDDSATDMKVAMARQ
jgi:arylsulfatase